MTHTDHAKYLGIVVGKTMDGGLKNRMLIVKKHIAMIHTWHCPIATRALISTFCRSSYTCLQ